MTTDSPADYIFGSRYGFDGYYLFDDGTKGYIADPMFDPEEFNLTGKYSKAIGNLYIDRWDDEGNFFQGGCFLYLEGETLRDYCLRNDEPIPVRPLTDEEIKEAEALGY